MLNRSYKIKQSGELRTLELYLYGEIEGDYYDWLQDKFFESTTSANYIKKTLDEAGNIDVINVYINSIGGNVDEGIAIHNILKRHPATVNVCIDAFAYSIASVIAMAGDKVKMPSNTTMMIHNAMRGCYGNSAQLRKSADDLDVINEASCNSYLVKSNGKIDKETLVSMLDAETYLTAEMAVKYGFADEIVNPINLADSVDIIQQAQQKKNPNAKMAFDTLNASKIPINNGSTEEYTEQTANEWFAGLFK